MFPVTLVDEIRRSPNVKSASPLLTFTIITDEYINRSWVLAGFDPADMESVRMASCSATDVIEGRLIEAEDAGMVLLEQTFADAEQYRVGDIIYLGDSEFTVAGILTPGTRPAKADIYMPLQEAVQVLNTRIERPVMNVANVVLVDGASAFLNNHAISDVKEILGFNSSTIGYGCFNPAGAAMGITMRGMRILGLIVFASVMILIVASQYYSVVERQNDIGILKAIGWSDRNVISQVMAESFIQSVIGGIAGSVAAIIIFISLPVDFLFGIEGQSGFSINTVIVTTGYILTVFAGTVAGLISALASLRLQPADILRRI
jgi:putative ABC transport system permease protein